MPRDRLQNRFGIWTTLRATYLSDDDQVSPTALNAGPVKCTLGHHNTVVRGVSQEYFTHPLARIHGPETVHIFPFVMRE
jgi:hypothetical protein